MMSRNAEDSGIDNYKAPCVLTPHSGAPSGLDSIQIGPSDLEHSHDISAIALRPRAVWCEVSVQTDSGLIP
jgi:hypothetical protein